MDLDLNECETLNGGCEHQCKTLTAATFANATRGFPWMEMERLAQVNIYYIEINIDTDIAQ